MLINSGNNPVVYDYDEDGMMNTGITFSNSKNNRTASNWQNSSMSNTSDFNERITGKKAHIPKNEETPLLNEDSKLSQDNVSISLFIE